MDNEFYDNLLRATDNTSDIINEKYGTVVKINGALCSVIEEDNNLEHTNVPVINHIYLETGDKVVIGFVDNSIYNPIIVGNLTRGIRLSTDDIIEPSSLNNLGLPANSNQHQINLKVNEKINQGGGGSTGVVMVGSFRINDEGHLIVTLPMGTLNPYHINEQGHLIYSTNPQITSGGEG